MENRTQVLINLLPQDKEKIKRRKEIATAAVLILAAVVSTGLWYLSLKGTLKAEQERNQELKAKLAKYEIKEDFLSDFKSLEEKLQKKRQAVSEIENRKIYFNQIMDNFSDINKQSPFITYMEVKPDYINIEGIAQDYDDMLAYLEWLLSQDEMISIEKMASWTSKDTGKLNFRVSVRWEGSAR
ncbi:hypothetical protein [Thermosyntropha sp.]|uniref:PilN domain-containing protein n=1 Tax=Thermosyntropha sp. TaxID=2740820 RepID=UPI0025FB0318|nr:hypothetical protein [Thermosyntropha sp.]MBO8159233.1 hypothetical protein [Thermosyntropha sp.]